jgi:hypothetical protein
MEALDDEEDPVLFDEDSDERLGLPPPSSGEPGSDGDMQSSIITVWSSEKLSRSSSSLSRREGLPPPQRLNGVILMNSSKTVNGTTTTNTQTTKIVASGYETDARYERRYFES